MSFQQKSFWVHRDAGVTTNGEMNSENSSKIEPKRGHQWFMDGTSPELLSNKRQATESIKENAIPEVSIGVSSWDNAANIQPISGPFTGRLFGSQSMKSSTLLDRNIAPFSAGDANYVENPFANGSSSMSLSMSHVIEDSSSFFNYGGLRKVRINQVREQEKSMPSPLESFYRRANDSAMTMDSHYSKTDASTISLGPSHPDMNENSISMTTGYSKGEESFLSMGHGFSKEGGSFIPMGHIYKVAENFIPMNPLHKDNDDSSSICHSFDKFDANTVHIDPTPTYVKSDSGFLSMGHTGNGVGNTVCFGGFSDGTESNASGAMIGSYELVLDAEGSVQASEVPNQKTLVDSNAYTPNPIVNTTSAKSNVNSRADNTTKNKDPKAAKKPAPNNFPSNVKSLLSTGILDGVPVKYVSWSREKNMRGIIKGTGYLCGCSECNHTKSLNAYEFERHADCKTKHPNNHIYFDNGKTIYAVVQELKNTPQEMLFDAIQTVTGSAINQKNFLSWKASYQAATRELQRIYGKDEVKLPC